MVEGSDWRRISVFSVFKLLENRLICEDSPDVERYRPKHPESCFSKYSKEWAYHAGNAELQHPTQKA
jgi:hypothetical protein